MTDREKVIKGLECCAEMSGDECRKCPYGDECLVPDFPCGMSHLAADALALLREQEPVPPDTAGAPWWRCGNCGGDIVTEQFKFCPWCGKAVKWD